MYSREEEKALETSADSPSSEVGSDDSISSFYDLLHSRLDTAYRDAPWAPIFGDGSSSLDREDLEKYNTMSKAEYGLYVIQNPHWNFFFRDLCSFDIAKYCFSYAGIVDGEAVVNREKLVELYETSIMISSDPSKRRSFFSTLFWNLLNKWEDSGVTEEDTVFVSALCREIPEILNEPFADRVFKSKYLNDLYDRSKWDIVVFSRTANKFIDEANAFISENGGVNVLISTIQKEMVDAGIFFYNLSEELGVQRFTEDQLKHFYALTHPPISLFNEVYKKSKKERNIEHRRMLGNMIFSREVAEEFGKALVKKTVTGVATGGCTPS